MNAKPLKYVIQDIETIEPPSSLEIDIEGLAYDSRKVGSGYLFFAIPGLKVDGHNFIPDAVKRGAVAVVLENDRALPPNVRKIRVADSRKAMAEAADNFYDHPSSRLSFIGVTGTDGKTSVCRLIHSILSLKGETGLMGTVGHIVMGREVRADRTTPEALEINRMLAELVEGGAKYAVMEVSSHALALSRAEGLDFDVAVFTNISQEHLDFHRDMESYFEAKARLFTGMKPGGLAVINIDDPRGAEMAARSNCKVMRYSLQDESAELCGEILTSTIEGLSMKIRCPQGSLELESRLIGTPNAYNILAAVGAAAGLGCDFDSIVRGIAAFRGVRGRYEYIDCGAFGAVVDYAHTPQALENLLQVMRPYVSGKLRAVFGCGGNRDRGKRPLMATAAEKLADIVYVTSDNPRYEKPEAIIEDIIAGLQYPQKARVIPDRKQAIIQALEDARKGDLVILGGKGHEDYQEIEGEFIHLDDREIVKEWLTKEKL